MSTTIQRTPELVSAPCGGCGQPQERMDLIKKVVSGLMYGHINVAIMYDQLALEQAPDSEDRRALLEAADRHRRLAKETEIVVVPDNLEIPK